MARGCSESQSVLSTTIRKLNIQLCISFGNSDQHLAVTMETSSSTSTTTECFSERAEEIEFNYGGFLHQQPLINYPDCSIHNKREASLQINQGLVTLTTKAKAHIPGVVLNTRSTQCIIICRIMCCCCCSCQNNSQDHCDQLFYQKLICARN